MRRATASGGFQGPYGSTGQTSNGRRFSAGATSRRSLVQETSMTLIWLGVLLVFGGVLQMAFQPIWRGRLSGRRRLRSGRPSDTLEPERPASGFGIKSNWPGLAMLVL